MKFLFLILCVGGAAYAQKLQLAVMLLEPKGIPARKAELLSESLLGHLQNRLTFKAIERPQAFHLRQHCARIASRTLIPGLQ
jgi:hypothetical protein